jgi:UDP-arabinose 4-epimerase
MATSIDRNILVTGGAGYVGSQSCKALRGAGFSPVVFDNLSTGRAAFVKWGPFVEGDILDAARLDAAFNQFRPIAVMHFAALALVGESMIAASDYWRVNVGGSHCVLDAMRRAAVDKLVFSSTCAIYGDPRSGPIHEDIAKAPVSPYGASKLAAERMMDDFDSAYRIRSARLRYFNACGADPAADIGEDRDVETHLIPLVLDAAREDRPSIRVYGNDYPTPDGTAIRDYVHVADIADAHVRALIYLISGGATLAFNLGTGRGASVAEVIAAAERVVDRAIARAPKERRQGDPASVVADPQRAMRILAWRPRRSDLDTIMSDAWAWRCKRFGGKKRPQAS